MKKKLMDIIIILAIIAFFLTSIINYNVIEIKKYDVRKGKIVDTATISGEIKTKEIESVTYNKECVVLEYFVDEGEFVNVGDPVFLIDMSYDRLSKDTEKEDLVILIEKEKGNMSSNNKTKMEIEMKKIELMEEDLVRLKEKYLSDKTLYESGLITESQLNISKANIDMKKIEIQETRVTYDSNLSLNDISDQESMNRLMELEKKLAFLLLKDTIYASIGEDGVYYSEFNGIIINMVSTNLINLKDKKLFEVAIIENFDSYLFEGYVNVEDSDKVNVGNIIDFYDGVIIDPIKGSVLKKYSNVENNKIKIEAEFLEDRSAKLGYGREFYAENVDRPISDMLIPKSAIITNQIIKEGDIVELFTIDENDKGEPRAKLISVEVEYVGDQNIGVNSQSSDFKIESVILNPSYKIKDGVKIKW